MPIIQLSELVFNLQTLSESFSCELWKLLSDYMIVKNKVFCYLTEMLL